MQFSLYYPYSLHNIGQNLLDLFPNFKFCTYSHKWSQKDFNYSLPQNDKMYQRTGFRELERMNWEGIKGLSQEEFRRLTGMKRETFDEMVKLLRASRKEKLSKGGASPKLKIEEILLMTLEYLREYPR